MRSLMITGILALSYVALPGMAQQAPVTTGVVASEAGKAAMAELSTVTAVVTAIDGATRTVTLKGPKGRMFDVVAGDEVKNFAQIKVKDEVAVEYFRSLTMELKKGGGVRSSAVATDAASAKAGAKPAGAVGRQVTVMADVVDVNPKAKTITLKGPKGNFLELDVKNPDQFKVVKKGDQVEAVYTEALAVSVVPVAKN
jgi:ribosomal protein L6P/L9E